MIAPLFRVSVNTHYRTLWETRQLDNLVLVKGSMTQSLWCVPRVTEGPDCRVHDIRRNQDLLEKTIEENLEFFSKGRWWGWAWGFSGTLWWP